MTADILAGTLADIEAGPYIAGFTGAQVYVARHGETLLHEARGHACEDRPMTTGTLLAWLSCAKPLTAFAAVRALEDSGLNVETPVRHVVAEFGQQGKEEATFAHLLTHTVPYRSFGVRYRGPGLPATDDDWMLDTTDWVKALDVICREPVDERPGDQVVYTSFASWHVLAEAVQRLTGTDYETFVTEQVVRPLGLRDTQFLPSPAFLAEREESLGYIFTLTESGPRRIPSEEPEAIAGARAVGFSARGPASDLALLTECLRNDGMGQRGRVVSEQAAQAIASNRRTGLPDGCYRGLDASWGLGVTTEPLVFGLPAGSRVVGHTGYRSSFVVSDLDNGVTVAYISTGRSEADVDPDRPRKWRLMRMIYRELGITG